MPTPLRPGRRHMACRQWPREGSKRWQGTLFHVLIAAAAVSQVWPCFASDLVSVAPNLIAARSLGVSANGQTVISIDGKRNAILAGDPAREDAWREVVAAPADGLPIPVAVGCLPGDVVAAVYRGGDEWTLRTYRIRPALAADPTEPVQVIQLGVASGQGDHVSIAVNHQRGWLVVAGLPTPLPPVLRAAIAGVRIGPLSDRSCPVLPEAYRPVAVTIGPAGDLVLALRSAQGDDAIAYYDASGREILRLPAGVPRISGIDFGRGDTMLWAVGSGADRRSGLWRLDAVFQHGRQRIDPTLVHAINSPAAIASASERAIVIIHGEPGSVSRIDPSTIPSAASRSPSP